MLERRAGEDTGLVRVRFGSACSIQLVLRSTSTHGSFTCAALASRHTLSVFAQATRVEQDRAHLSSSTAAAVGSVSLSPPRFR